MLSATLCNQHAHMGSGGHLGRGMRTLPGSDHRCAYCSEPCDGRLYGVNSIVSAECESAELMRQRAAEHPCEQVCIGQPGHRGKCWPKSEREKRHE